MFKTWDPLKNDELGSKNLYFISNEKNALLIVNEFILFQNAIPKCCHFMHYTSFSYTHLDVL